MKRNMCKSLGRKKTIVLWISLLFVFGMFTPTIITQNIKIISNQSTDAIDSNTLPNNIPQSNPDPLPLYASVSLWNEDWRYRKEITINHTKVGANLTNFPLLIYLNSDIDLANNAQDNGDDIVFTDDSDNQLNHEIEYFDNSTGELVAWVNVTSISSTEYTIIYIYYGNPDCGCQQNVNGVWDSGFVMVQHLEEIIDMHYDSTSYDNDGSPQGGLNQDAIGIFDGGDEFDGVDDCVEIRKNIWDGMEQFTIEAWAKFYNFDNTPGIFSKGNDNYIQFNSNKIGGQNEVNFS